MNLIRSASTDQGTPGKLDVIGLCTIELPWNDNQHNISCIPIGEYDLEYYDSPEHGEVLRVLNVPDRDGVLMHSGNYAGDESKGFKTDSKGCIIVGKIPGMIGNQTAVLESRIAVGELIAAFKAGTIDKKLIITQDEAII